MPEEPVRIYHPPEAPFESLERGVLCDLSNDADLCGAMSLYYEIVFSLFLRDNVPGEALDELHWHLGLSTQRPDACAIDYAEPQLVPNPRSCLPGGEVAELRRQYRYSHAGIDHHAWGLYTRLFWLDDRWAEVWWQVATWLSTYAADDGYAGFYREEQNERPTLLLVRGSEPHLCDFDGQPRAFTS